MSGVAAYIFSQDVGQVVLKFNLTKTLLCPLHIGLISGECPVIVSEKIHFRYDKKRKTREWTIIIMHL